MRVIFEVPGEPVGKGRPRFNGHRAFTPEKTRAYEAKMRRIYEQEVGHKFDGYVRMRVEAYYSIAKSDSKKKKAQKISGELRPSKRPDLDNIIKMMDAINGVAFHDDAQVVEINAVKYFSEHPRVVFIIEDIEEEKQCN